MLQIIATTLELAAITSLILLMITPPLGWWLVQQRGWLSDSIAAITSLPLVLPPTVLGFYLLVCLGPEGPLAPLLHFLGIRTLAFSFWGLVAGSVIYSLPFALQPVRTSFAGIPPRLLEAATCLRASNFDRFRSIALPLARPGLISAAILSFAHTIGEFGVVLMIGGDIPGRTRVLSTMIFDAVETQDYATANAIAAGLLLFSFLAILALRRFDRDRGR